MIQLPCCISIFRSSSIGIAAEFVQIDGLHRLWSVHPLKGRGPGVVFHRHVPALEVRLHAVAQVGNHGLGIGSEGAGALFDVIARQGQAGLQKLGVDTAVQGARQLLLERRARGGGRVLCEHRIGFCCYLFSSCLCPWVLG
ncbi:hypothetical protein D9M73_62650 [compost metagenome]